VLVELGLVEQRYRALLEVLNDGASVTDVARRYGVVRRTVHTWLRKYAGHGLAGLADASSRPQTCPHQMSPDVEARRRSDPKLTKNRVHLDLRPDDQESGLCGGLRSFRRIAA
jgi:transposase-like protein